MGIGDTIAVGRVLFSGNVPTIPPDEFWVPAKTNPTRCSIIPFGDIHIFIGKTNSGPSSQEVGNSSRHARTDYGHDTFAEESRPYLSLEYGGSD